MLFDMLDNILSQILTIDEYMMNKNDEDNRLSPSFVEEDRDKLDTKS